MFDDLWGCQSCLVFFGVVIFIACFSLNTLFFFRVEGSLDAGQWDLFKSAINTMSQWFIYMSGEWVVSDSPTHNHIPV